MTNSQAQDVSLYGGPEVATQAGIDYRTFYNWVKRGFIRASFEKARGSGTRNTFTADDLERAILLAALVREGMQVEAAACLPETRARITLAALRGELE